jgi:hypothetical protein
MLRSGFPDLQRTIDDLIAKGDKVVLRWTTRGTHQGEAFGVPATGRAMVVMGIEIYRVAGDKLVERWSEVDMLGQMQQLGGIPAPGQVVSTCAGRAARIRGKGDRGGTDSKEFMGAPDGLDARCTIIAE